MCQCDSVMTFWFFACLQLLDTVQKLKEINSVNENVIQSLKQGHVDEHGVCSDARAVARMRTHARTHAHVVLMNFCVKIRQVAHHFSRSRTTGS